MSEAAPSPSSRQPAVASGATRSVPPARRMLACPYCNYRQPAREEPGPQFCLNCDERLLTASACREYIPLEIINYALEPGPPGANRSRSTRPVVSIIRGPQPPDPDDADEADPERLELLAAYQPWYFRSWVILVFLFTLTPLGLVLLWEQRPREAFFGGAASRFLITLLLAPAWIVAVVAAQPLIENMASRIPVERIVPSERLITRADYDAIAIGDAYKQVKGILGQEGIVTSRHHLDAQPGAGGLPALDTVVYQWLNPDGSSLHAVFQNDKLQKKSQIGLR